MPTFIIIEIPEVVAFNWASQSIRLSPLPMAEAIIITLDYYYGYHNLFTKWTAKMFCLLCHHHHHERNVAVQINLGLGVFCYEKLGLTMFYIFFIFHYLNLCKTKLIYRLCIIERPPKE